MCTRKTLALAALACLCSEIAAQQVTIATPHHSNSNDYYQNLGVNFGFQYDGPGSQLFFRQGGGVPAGFGRFDPNSQSSFALRGRRGNWSWDFGLTGGQGSSSSSVTTTPFLTLPNGGFGFINSTISRPFVTGIVPVVGERVAADRERKRAEFAAAAETVSTARRLEEEKYAAELDAIRKQMRAKRPTTKKEMDKPLILRGKNSLSVASPPTAGR